MIFKDRLFWGATALAFWIKFNIVLFTFKPYTATKFYFPLFLLLLLWRGTLVRAKLAQADWALWAGGICVLSLLVPIGYLYNPHNWDIYRQFALSLGSFFVMFVAAFTLGSRDKRALLWAVYGFCGIALIYMLIQVWFNWHHQPGHFRQADVEQRAYGILDDPAHSSAVYFLGFSLTLFWVAENRRRWPLLILAPLFLFAIWVSQTLGMFLGLAGMLVIFLGLLPLVWTPFNQGRWALGLILSWIFGLVVLIWLANVYWRYGGWLYDWIDVNPKFWSFRLRIDLLFTAIKTILIHPFVGLGLANDHNPIIQEIWGTSHYIPTRHLHQHTTPFAVLVSGGLLSFFPFVFLIYFSIKAYLTQLQAAPNRSKRLSVLVLFSFFMGVQLVSYSVLMLFSVTYWFALILPHLLEGGLVKEPA